MTTPLRASFVTAFATVCIVLIPSFVYAALPAAPATHPDVTPPTNAPTEKLPATPLPQGAVVAPATTTAPATITRWGGIPSLLNGWGLYLFVGVIGVLALSGIWWLLISRRKDPASENAET